LGEPVAGGPRETSSLTLPLQRQSAVVKRAARQPSFGGEASDGIAQAGRLE